MELANFATKFEVLSVLRQILQVRLYSSLPNPQTARLEHFFLHWKSFIGIPHLPTFCPCGLVVDNIVDGEGS